MRPFYSLFVLVALGLSACCESRIQDSFPVVDYNSYRDTIIKDVLPFSMDSILPRDSGYYPQFSFDIKNSGTAVDSFTVTIVKNEMGFEIKHIVGPGETKTFRSGDPVKDSLPYPAQFYYESFFDRDSSQVHLQRLRPKITIRYGEIFLGPEGCNTEPNTMTVSAENFK